MGKWIDFTAILGLASAGVIGSLLVNRGAPISDDIILSLFMMGITSSMILIRKKYPSNIRKPPTFLRNTEGRQEEGEVKNEVFLLQRKRPRW